MNRMLLALLLALSWYPAAAAQGQSYPTRPIRLIVPFGPGGGIDIVARHITSKMPEGLGQHVVVDNRPGAAGTIGTELAQRSAPDGYTIVIVSSTHTINANLYSLPYHPVNGISTISLVGTLPFLAAVNPSVPARTIMELISHAKANPGKLNYASIGRGGINHLAVELFKLMANVDMVHIPYKGAGQALTDLIGGQIQLFFGSTVATLPHVRTGKVRGIAVTTPRRSAAAPDLPTISEAGVPGYDATQWYGIWGPPRLPANIVTRLNDEIRRILALPEVKNRFAQEGMELTPSSPEEFRRHLQAEIEKWGKVTKAANIILE